MSDALKQAQGAIEGEDYAAAAGWLEIRLAERPDDRAARAWLGQCLCSLGKYASGTAMLRQGGKQYVVAARDDKQTAVLLELAAELQHWRDIEGALPLLEAAAEINSLDPQGQHLLAIAYAQLNRSEEALASIGRAIAGNPRNTEAVLLQQSVLADSGRNEEAREGLERLLGEQLEPRFAYRVHKELARVLDKLSVYEDVFPHLHKAAGLARSIPQFAAFDPRIIPAIIRSNQQELDADLMARWSKAKFLDPAPVFIIGFLRSGTTLTQEVMGAHPDVFVSDEVDFVRQTMNELHRLNSARISLMEKLRKLDHAGIAALRQFYWDAVDNRFGAAARAGTFIDKFTANTIDVAFINTIFPDAKLVFVQRDPRDVCLSCFLQLMVPSLTTVQLLHWDHIARFFALVMQWWTQVRPHLTMAVHEFRYEDAVADFEKTFGALFEFAGMGWNPRVAEFHKNAAGRFIASPSRNQVAQPLYSSSVGRWRRYAREFAPVAATLAPAIAKLGYPSFETA